MELDSKTIFAGLCALVMAGPMAYAYTNPNVNVNQIVQRYQINEAQYPLFNKP